MLVDAPNVLSPAGQEMSPDVQQADGERQQTTTPGVPLTASAVCSVSLLPAYRSQALVAITPGLLVWQTCGAGCGAAQDHQPVVASCKSSLVSAAYRQCCKVSLGEISRA